MPKDVKDLAASRREEIVNACETLYKTKSFKDITIKDIGGATTFTRTSVYNYFETKEEIFLALLTREYLLWVSDLQTLLGESVLSRKEYAEALARSLQARPVMLKLLSAKFCKVVSRKGRTRGGEFCIFIFSLSLRHLPLYQRHGKTEGRDGCGRCEVRRVFRVRSRVQRGHKIVAIKNLYKGEETLWTKKFW